MTRTVEIKQGVEFAGDAELPREWIDSLTDDESERDQWRHREARKRHRGP